jgi:hypothetical protein
MSCVVTYNNQQIPEQEFIEKYIPEEGDVIEYNGIEYIVRSSATTGSQLVRGEAQLAIYEDGEDAAVERLDALDSIPVYDLDPAGAYSVELGGIDPIFNIPLTALLQNGFTKTGRRVETGKSDDLLFQREGTEVSKASPETIATIKEAAKKMGISIVDLADYAKKTGLSTKSINGVADLVQKVVAVAVGKQNVALTEEIVHIATAMLEQTNPEIITSMISEIGKYKIYKATLEQYKDDKNYQLPNGKPDIRKIKKEAVDKLISEYIIERSEGSTEFPELMEQEPRNLVTRWWDMIKDAIRSLYGKTKINIFKDVAERVISGEIEKVELKEGDVYFQKAENPAVDNFFDIIIDKASRLKLIPKIGDKKRHYEFDGVDVAKTITELISEDKNMPDRTGLDKEDDDRKAWWGTEGHEYLENYISQALIDKNGYALDEPLDIDPVSELNDDIRKHLRDFAKELIASYKPGTRFLLEKKVVNENVKGMLASTVDFFAIMPDDETGVKVDILDWKFMNINKDKTDDVPWYKQRDWKLQMSEYSKIVKNYGLKPNQLRRARMIPFAANYSYNIPGERSSGLVLTSLEVGKVDSLYETNLYLLPVPVNSESTGNPKVDALLRSLRIEYEKFYKKPVSEEDKPLKEITLNNMSKAIRSLHVKLDFSPLNALGKTFLNNAEKTLKSFEKINYDELSGEEIRKKLSDLKNLENSAKKYADLDSVFISQFPKEGLSKEDKETLDSLEAIATSTKRMFDVIRTFQSEYAVWLAIKEGVTTETTGLPAEVEIGTFEKSFLEPTKLSSRIINLAQKLILNGKSLVDIKANKLIDEFKPLLANLEKEAAAAGKSAFNLIGKIDGKEISLIKKVKSSFWKEMNDAISKRNKKFFLENMNVEAYNKKVSATIERLSKELEDVVYSTNEYENTLEREYRIAKLRNSIDINSATFNGYDGFNFRKLFQEFMNEEEQLSDEYKAMSPNALKMWNFFTNLNQRGKDMGYLTGKSISFFPLIEATMIEKFAKSDNKLKETKDFFKDFYTVRAQERANFAKTDPETGKVKREIPKYFTITDRNIDQLSTDLNKVGVLWIKSLLEYENSKNLEDVLLTLHSVEKAKGRIVTDKESNIIYDGDAPKIATDSNRSADLLETIIDDYIYGVRENVGSLGNLKIGQLSEKVSKTQEGKEKTQLSVKKAVETSNTLVQALAVGLKPLIAIPNYFGSNMQAFINSGSFYKFGTFERNNFEVTTGIGLSTIDKGLLDSIVPLNDDLTSEKRRELAKDKGFISYLGTWTFQDVMQVTNSAPERKLQFANAKSFNDNSMIVDGKIVNIRQYLRAQDRIGRKEKTYEERRALEKSFEARVTELRNTKSLPKVAVIENDKVVLPGVSDEELARYRTVVVEYGRNVTSQMSTNNKADYRRDTIFKSFMMFKNWIIKQVSLRTLGVRKNVELDEWEYGRARAFFSTIAHLGFKNITDLREIMMGTDKGLAIINEMLENKKRDYFLKTGQVLEITEEEFQDMIRQQITNQFKELGLLVGLLTLVIAAKAAEPPEDASDLEKNRYKWWAKNLNKITDELAFYYNPLSADSITRGSILPALSLLTKTQQAFWNLGKEVAGNVVDDEELIEKTYPTKYFLDLIPGVSQFQREILPYIDPEFAKEMGIRVSAEARRR